MDHRRTSGARTVHVVGRFARVALAIAAPLAIVASAPSLLAQGLIANAQLERRTVSGGLEAEVRSILSRGTAIWFVYRMPMVAGERHLSSPDTALDGRCCVCRLDSGAGVFLTDREPRGLRVTLEPPKDMLVFARAEGGRIVRLRTFTPDCEIDGGGMPVVWLDGVHADDSVAWLTSLVGTSARTVTDRDEHDIARPALAALALHDSAAADRALERFSAPDADEGLRRQTAFWLGSARGEAGVNVLGRMIAQDPSARVRERAVFGLSVSNSPSALSKLIAIARDNPDARLRGRALFWLAQKAGRAAADTVAAAVENDPDIDVKKRAVFALGQLPKDEGVPKLIELARTHRNREIRRQAMIELGRSNDARAVKFFEEVLTK